MKPLITRETAQRRPFGLLLAAIVSFLVLVVIVADSSEGQVIISLAFTGILVAGIGITRQTRSFMAVTLVLVPANLFAQWLAQFLVGDRVDREVLKSLLGALYFLLLAGALLRLLVRQTEASVDTIVGGINVYLLLAIMFALLHLALEYLLPGSYVRDGLALSAEPAQPKGGLGATFLYFSFISITTLGYGDIVPARPGSQLLCAAEAVIGQLYVAILIGGLVALWIGGQLRPSPGEQTD